AKATGALPSPGRRYCRRRSGATPASASNDLAVRVPVPVTMKAMSPDGAQPGRSTISCTMAERSDVRWSAPLSPLAVHAAGLQDAEASVIGRDETLNLASVSGAALSLSSPRIRSDEAPLLT